MNPLQLTYPQRPCTIECEPKETMMCKRCGALTPPVSKDSRRLGTPCARCEEYKSEQSAIAIQNATFSAILGMLQ